VPEGRHTIKPPAGACPFKPAGIVPRGIQATPEYCINHHVSLLYSDCLPATEMSHAFWRPLL
jgi:hypothetical protein